ncbi:protein GRAVITROPIC IN THE LIGHT 1 [Ricinus communis]|uniref:Uncharacterized protein n=1 Tax=Ricinus communis TaxID=3988 RepID=B9RX03_RICCO|nr:protein GRAVITROPIC IN THE LIGHT 1 [Ricinus communis]XP_015574153.1 protein GRAVITROPIC IN THE LIGHT 1 [Ricinus communis]XP_015574154.1 protein GRAVITROPIC IN THE LIGHT 1 [Ricinus communis]XP_048227353.1 protein GRAVITROPIC IN THE LIGHT 1 [Ricinus communis]EEF44032.1 conserved hypothetical protein [Ricinus communis]|eukprot:XP_002518272.1 protein GRAVITROPIC IN THE LIGHT 1 [Ricinus communis]
MEHATSIKPSKPSPNISEMVSKFAKICKLRSIGVFSNENPNQQHHQYQHCLNNNNVPSVSEDSSDATEETECDGEKIHPQPAVVPSKRHVCGGGDYVLQLFDAVSALKLAYIQLQEAHVPYNPDKIVAADENIVVQLEALCKIKRTYKEKRFIDSKLGSCHSDLRTKIEVNERLLEKLKSQNRAKDAEIARLRQQLHDLDSGTAILVEKMRQKSLEIKNRRILNIAMFEDTFKMASKSIHDFAKPMISLMKASGWDLNLAANSIESGVVYFRRSDKKYAFEAYIARRMFHGIALKSYNVNGVMRYDDPINSLIEDSSSGFSSFCRKKYLFVVHPMMEMSFFGNLDQRLFVLSGKHPRTPFYQIFARMAKWVWVLQGIATSVDPNAEMYAVNRGSIFSDIYMEPIQADIPNRGQSDSKVEFMVMPGFRFGDILMRCQVYLSC